MEWDEEDKPQASQTKIDCAPVIVIGDKGREANPGRSDRKDLLHERRSATRERREDLKERREEKQKLNAEERAAYRERLRAYREQRKARRERSRSERMERREAIKDACAKGKAENTAQAQQLMSAERAIHLKRLAQIDRLEVVALEEDKKNLLERAARLRTQELKRHTARMERINAVCADGAPTNPAETR